MNEKPTTILNQRQTELLNAEKVFFQHFQQALDLFGTAPPQDRELLAKVSVGLDELFLLVVVGEFNSGKSSFINALIGRQVLAEGATPTTSQINVLRYGSQPLQQRSNREREVLEITYPATFLQEISIVDTPGTNAIIERHQALTEEFVPRSDLVIFVTSAERPFTQSERQFIEKVRNWGKKIVVVINKIDLLSSQEDYRQVIQFVADGFRQLLGIEPPIFAVSGRLATLAKTQPNPQLWQRSGFGPLETYIFSTLDQASRIRLKLLNPLAVAERLLDRYQNIVNDRLSLLEQDSRALANIEQQLELYQNDLRRDFEARIDRVNNLLYELNTRADRFFDDVLKVTRVFDLVKTDRIKRDFEERVVADTPRLIEQTVQEMVEWVVEREGRTLREVSEYLRERRKQQAGEPEQALMIGRPDADFDQFNTNRRLLLQQVGERTRAVMQSFDERAEAEKLNLSVKSALKSTALTEAGAVGLGAALAILISTAAADLTGLLLTLVIGGVGFYIIPARRRRAKYEFRHKLETLRGQLSHVLQEQFQNELTVSTERIREALAPYTRFIKTEQTRLNQLNSWFGNLRQEMNNLQNAIEQATPQLNAPSTNYPAQSAVSARPNQDRITQPGNYSQAVSNYRKGENEPLLFPPDQYKYS